MTAAWLLSWWNLIFIVPFGLAMVYLGLYTMTGLGGDNDADADADADAEAHGDLGHDTDADGDHGVHSAEMHHGHAAAHGHEHEQGHASAAQREPSMHETLLNLVGVGRAPLGIVLMILLMSWGFIGFSINQIVRPIVPADWMVALASLPLAAFGSVAVTGGIARLVARLLPTTTTTAHRRRELCGCVGEAMYEITSNFGMVAVRDRDGNHYQLPCRVSADRGPIAKGEPVLLVRYDPATKMYDVIADELGRAARALNQPAPDAAAVERTMDSAQERDRVSQ
ncbi:MAG TPA: hypothetical protein VGR35_06440 [Tepidisphaeraceae bacterium]|nr:hypothetical protein [Tepidisphaeraceae bacterium]